MMFQMLQGLNKLPSENTHTYLVTLKPTRIYYVPYNDDRLDWNFGWIILRTHLHLKSPLLHCQNKKDEQEYGEDLSKRDLSKWGERHKARRAQAI
jgi:hypothetical protein